MATITLKPTPTGVPRKVCGDCGRISAVNRTGLRSHMRKDDPAVRCVERASKVSAAAVATRKHAVTRKQPPTFIDVTSAAMPSVVPTVEPALPVATAPVATHTYQPPLLELPALILLTIDGGQCGDTQCLTTATWRLEARQPGRQASQQACRPHLLDAIDTLARFAEGR